MSEANQEREQAAIDDPEAYFASNARYDPRNKNAPYSIIFRGYGFVSRDTMDLAKRFYRAVARHKRSLHRESK